MEKLYAYNNNPVIYVGTNTPHLQNPATGKTFCGKDIPRPVQIGLSYEVGCKRCLELAEKITQGEDEPEDWLLCPGCGRHTFENLPDGKLKCVSCGREF